MVDEFFLRPATSVSPPLAAPRLPELNFKSVRQVLGSPSLEYQDSEGKANTDYRSNSFSLQLLFLIVVYGGEPCITASAPHFSAPSTF